MRCLLPAALLISFLLSQAQAAAPALTLAQGLLDGTISAADTATIGGQTYLAAAQMPYASGETSVVLLRKIGQSYIRVWSTSIDTFLSSADGVLSVSVLDLDGNHQPEVLYSYAQYGNGDGTESYDLYDLATKKTYHSYIQLDKFAGRNTAVYDSALLDPRNVVFLKAVSARVDASAHAPKVVPLMAWERWLNRYGGVESGRRYTVTVVPEWLPASECGQGSTLESEVKFAGLTYRAVFKHGVYAFDASLRRCFIVYYPPSPYDWIDQLSVSRGVLTLLRGGKAVVMYMPGTRLLERPLLK